MGACNSAPSHGPGTYNLDVATFDKLDRFCTKMNVRSSVVTKLRVAFRRLDHDKSGRISMAEFLVMFGLERTKVRRAFVAISPLDRCKVGEVSDKKSPGQVFRGPVNGRLATSEASWVKEELFIALRRYCAWLRHWQQHRRWTIPRNVPCHTQLVALLLAAPHPDLALACSSRHARSR